MVYTQYVQYSFPDWAAKMFPAKHPAISLNDKGQPKAVLPHITIYELCFDKAGMIQYRIEGESKWTTAVVGKDDIERYYEFAVGTTDEADNALKEYYKNLIDDVGLDGLSILYE